MKRPQYCSLIALCAGFFMAWIGLSLVARQNETRFEELALGDLTTSFFPEVDGYPIHISKSVDSRKWQDGWTHRGERPVGLWLGNSQLHAINQASPDSKPASIRTFSAVESRGLDVLSWSIPNANLQEHYVLFENVRSRMSVRFLMLPVVFDDFRETGIRANVAELLSDDSTRFSLSRTSIGAEILEANPAEVQPSAADEETVDAGTSLQDTSEAALDDLFENHSKVYSARKQMRGKLFIELYELRNRTFGITAQSVRKKIPGRYALNREALLAILESAKAANIRTLVYVVPLRQDVKTPYAPRQYAEFKQDMQQCASLYEAKFVDLDKLVPGELWGKMADVQGEGAGYDFMHFQDGGHALLSEEILKQIEPLLNEIEQVAP